MSANALLSHTRRWVFYRWLISFSSWLHTPSTKTTPFCACEKYIRGVLTRLWRKCGAFVPSAHRKQHPRADPEVSVGVKPSFILSEICPSLPPHGGGNWIQYYLVGSRALGELILSACERLCRFETSPTSRGVIRGCQENCCRHLENVWIKGFPNVAGTLYSPLKKKEEKKALEVSCLLAARVVPFRLVSKWFKLLTDIRARWKERSLPGSEIEAAGYCFRDTDSLSCQNSHWPSVSTLRSRRDTRCVRNFSCPSMTGRFLICCPIVKKPFDVADWSGVRAANQVWMLHL